MHFDLACGRRSGFHQAAPNSLTNIVNDVLGPSLVLYVSEIDTSGCGRLSGSTDFA